MTPRPNHEELTDSEFEVFLCPNCGNWDTAYIGKSGAIGCYACGIHPGLPDQPSPGDAGALKAALLSGPRPASWNRLG